MKREDIEKSFSNVEPDENATNRMLNNVLNHSDSRKTTCIKSFNLKKVLPAAMVAVLAISVISFDLLDKSVNNDIATEKLAENQLVGEDAREDMAIETLNQFKIGNKYYLPLLEWEKEELNISDVIKDRDIGEKITTITDSNDEGLKGLDVYKYLPAGGEVIVALQRENNYELYKFFSFESYNNNKDEDVKTYLKLYGINSSAGISKVQFIGHGEDTQLRGQIDLKAEITDQHSITEFYNLYSVLKDSSDKYFERLLNSSGSNEPLPDAPFELPSDYRDSDYTESGNTEPGDTGSDDKVSEPGVGILPAPSPDHPVADTDQDQDETGNINLGEPAQWTEPSEGSIGDALFNGVTIRIYNQQGIYFETMYYPNMGFISRHEVSEELEAFLRNILE